jgi:hypothetical protein
MCGEERGESKKRNGEKSKEGDSSTTVLVTCKIILKIN